MNKLAEVMNRRVTVRGGHRGNDTEVHRREKENRKLQLELRAEKEKLNSTIIKYQREMTDMQAVSNPAEVPSAAAPGVLQDANVTTFDIQLLAEENQVRLELQMALDSKESDIEQLRCQLSTLSVHSLDSTSLSSGNDLDTSEGYPGMPRRLLGVLPASLTLASQVLAVSFVFSSSFKLSGLLFELVPHTDSVPPLPPRPPTALLGGPVQCALLTPAPPNLCPSPTSARTNPSASTRGPTCTRLSLTPSLRTRTNVTGGWSRAKPPWPSPMSSPLRLNLEVTPAWPPSPRIGA